MQFHLETISVPGKALGNASSSQRSNPDRTDHEKDVVLHQNIEDDTYTEVTPLPIIIVGDREGIGL